MLSLLSLCKKAGRLKSGEEACIESVRNGTAYLIVVAKDASDNTKKKFSDKTTYYEIPIIIDFTKEELGHAIGKEMAASIAVLDEGFAKALVGKRR